MDVFKDAVKEDGTNASDKKNFAFDVDKALVHADYQLEEALGVS